jgi:hypothetical protein
MFTKLAGVCANTRKTRKSKFETPRKNETPKKDQIRNEGSELGSQKIGVRSRE